MFFQWLRDAWAIGKLAWHFAPVLWQQEAFFRNDENADVLVDLLSQRGPFYLKLGQWIGQRPDIVPQSFCDKLKTLQTEAPHHSWQETCSVVDKNIDLASFVTFVDCDVNGEPQCLSSGSIAQVYRIRVARRKLQQLQAHFAAEAAKSGGDRDVEEQPFDEVYWEPVSAGEAHGSDSDVLSCILKVCHPDVQSQFASSLRTVTQVYSFVQRMSHHLSGLRLIDVNELSSEMLRQCNLLWEAHNGARLRRNFANNSYVHVPHIYLATANFLVEEYVEGGLFYDQIGQEGVDPFDYHGDDKARKETRLLAKQITMAAFFQMIMYDGFAHGDCHSGNILYRLTPKPERKYRAELEDVRMHMVDGKPLRVSPVTIEIFFLDFGIAVAIDKNTREAMLELTISINANDPRLMVRAFKRIMVDRRLQPRKKMSDFEADCIETSRRLQEDDLHGQGSKFQDQMLTVLENFRIHQLRVESAALRIIIGWMLIDENAPVHSRSDNLPDNTIRWVMHEDAHDCFKLHDLGAAVIAARIKKDHNERILMERQEECDTTVNDMRQLSENLFRAPDIDAMRERRKEKQQAALNIVEVLEATLDNPHDANSLGSESADERRPLLEKKNKKRRRRAAVSLK